jgi:hypothetical protein
MSRQPETGNSWWKRLGWFVLIWTCSVTALGLAAYAMRLLMKFAGLTAG